MGPNLRGRQAQPFRSQKLVPDPLSNDSLRPWNLPVLWGRSGVMYWAGKLRLVVIGPARGEVGKALVEGQSRKRAGQGGGEWEGSEGAGRVVQAGKEWTFVDAPPGWLMAGLRLWQASKHGSTLTAATHMHYCHLPEDVHPPHKGELFAQSLEEHNIPREQLLRANNVRGRET